MRDIKGRRRRVRFIVGGFRGVCSGEENKLMAVYERTRLGKSNAGHEHRACKQAFATCSNRQLIPVHIDQIYPGPRIEAATHPDGRVENSASDGAAEMVARELEAFLIPFVQICQQKSPQARFQSTHRLLRVPHRRSWTFNDGFGLRTSCGVLFAVLDAFSD